MKPIIKVVDVVAGTTIRATWVSSGVTPTSIFSRILDNAEALVNSASGISSGNGFYYAPHTMPTSRQWYVQEWQAVIEGFPYIDRMFVKTHGMEVD